jgi:hypothetical protein
MKIDKEKLIKSIQKSIANAHKKYKEMSGGYYWLGDAPEYYLTVKMATQIKKDFKDEVFIVLEQKVNEFLKESKSVGPGRPSKDVRINGKIDITLMSKDLSPIGLIEVKCPLWDPAGSKADIDRIKQIVTNSRKNGGQIEFGILAFFSQTSAKENDKPKDQLFKRLKNIYDNCQVDSLNCSFYPGKDEIHKSFHIDSMYGINSKTDEDIKIKGAWAATCVIIEP